MPTAPHHAARLPIGQDDFRKLREAELEYVDKSRLLMGILDAPGIEVFLFPRPRRFGKTLNLSMLRCFLARSSEDLSYLFKDLEVWRGGPGYLDHFQRYPVILLTFKGIRPTGLESWAEGLQRLLHDLYLEHRDLLEGDLLAPSERRDFEAILDGTASETAQAFALLRLTGWLHRATGQRVVLLIDEYDTPIHAAYLGGFLAPVIAFFRTFLGEALKGNPHLFKAVITGILRVAKENIFSGLNNISVFTLLNPEFADCFGFTGPEVERLAARLERSEVLETLRRWYNGYRFGDETVYNPWSVLSYFRSQHEAPQPYWLNTSSNELIRAQLVRRALVVHRDLEALLEGETVDQYIADNVVLSDLDRSDETFWGLLVFSGYLNAQWNGTVRGGNLGCRLSIPNLEVREIYVATFQQWLQDTLPRRGRDVDALIEALLSGDADRVQALIQAFVGYVLSFHDTRADAEDLYHGFLVGLCAAVEPTYHVRSNREAGRGRPDVMILPAGPGQPGAVIEVKIARKGRRTLKQALEEAVSQIQSRDYAAELERLGVSQVYGWAMAFDQKRVKVELVTPSEPSDVSGKGA